MAFVRSTMLSWPNLLEAGASARNVRRGRVGAPWSPAACACVLLAVSACSLEVPSSGRPTDGPGSVGGQGGFPSPGGLADAAGAGPASGYDASVALKDGGSPGDAVPLGCPIDGRYAVEVLFDVSWVGTQFARILPVISAGEGQLSFTAVGEFVTTASGTDFAFRNCQTSVPEFISTLPQERYQVRFADAVWDSPSMPNFRGQVTGCPEPGCSLSSTPIRALIGSALSDPDAAWPSSASSGQWPDHDGDGRPGVSAFMLGPSTGGGVAYPPVDLLGFRRVQKLDLGMRVSMTLNGRRTSCDTIEGDVEDGAIDTRGLACIATTRPMSCQPDEVQFLDDNLPAWTVRQGTFRGVRVKDSDGCDEVRGLTGIGLTPSP